MSGSLVSVLVGAVQSSEARKSSHWNASESGLSSVEGKRGAKKRRKKKKKAGSKGGTLLAGCVPVIGDETGCVCFIGMAGWI